MSKLLIKVINQSRHSLPEYATVQSAGLDLKANITEPIVLKSLQRTLVSTGLFIQYLLALKRRYAQEVD